MKAVFSVVIFATIGLVVGYLFFARFNGQWISVGDIFKFYESGIVGQALANADNLIRGTSVIRQKY